MDRTREQARYEAERLLIWAGEPGWAGGWRAEVAEVEFGDGLCARGTQLATDPLPYRLDYRLDASAEGCVTRSLRIAAVGEGWARRLRLERDPGGEWTAAAESEGELGLPALVAMPSTLVRRSTATSVSRRSQTRCRCCATACIVSRGRRTS